MFQFNFDAQKGETPASIAQKRALVAQIMGSAKAPSTVGEGFSALGDGIVANVLGGRAEAGQKAGDAQADDVKSRLFAAITGQGAPNPSYGTSASGGDFLSGLINSESGGNWGALNDEGYGGRLQFGDARLADAAKAGVIEPGTTGAGFSRMSPEQQQAVEAWHFADIDQQAANMGLDQYIGQNVGGVPITPESIRAMAHLGGIGGVQKFISSGGQYNPADSNGTRLSDYGGRFGGGGQPPQPTSAPVQVAALGDASSYAPQAGQTAPQAKEGAFPQAGGQQALLPPIAPPQQIAQAPMQPQMAMLMEAISSPWLDEGTKAMAMQELQRLQQLNDPLRQMQLQAAQQGIEKGNFELDALRNPAAPKPIEVGGVLVDPVTYQPVFDSRQPSNDGFTLSAGEQRFDASGKPIASVPANADDGLTDTQRNLAWRAEQAGLTAGTPEYAEFMRSGGQSTGMALSVGPDGTVQFSQGGAGGGKPLTEGQSKDAVFVTRANNAMPTIDKYENALLSFGESLAGNVPYGNYLQSEEYQVARDAGREFLATVLRKDTGAAVTPSEEAMYGDMLLPRPGDKPATIEMKRRRRAVAVTAIEAGMPPQAIMNSVEALTRAGVVGSDGMVMPDANPAPNQSQPPSFSSQSDFDAAPSGTVFKAPDGSIRVKP